MSHRVRWWEKALQPVSYQARDRTALKSSWRRPPTSTPIHASPAPGSASCSSRSADCWACQAVRRARPWSCWWAPAFQAQRRQPESWPPGGAFPQLSNNNRRGVPTPNSAPGRASENLGRARSDAPRRCSAFCHPRWAAASEAPQACANLPCASSQQGYRSATPLPHRRVTHLLWRPASRVYVVRELRRTARELVQVRAAFRWQKMARQGGHQTAASCGTDGAKRSSGSFSLPWEAS